MHPLQTATWLLALGLQLRPFHYSRQECRKLGNRRAGSWAGAVLLRVRRVSPCLSPFSAFPWLSGQFLRTCIFGYIFFFFLLAPIAHYRNCGAFKTPLPLSPPSLFPRILFLLAKCSDTMLHTTHGHLGAVLKCFDAVS